MTHRRNMIARAAAIAAGAVIYFSGIPCSRGHLSARRVDNKSCMECLRQRRARFCADNPEKLVAYEARRYAAHRERFRARAKLRPSLKVQAQNARRRARKYAAACSCCRWRDIENVHLARPVGHEVDHVLALALGGKHCLANLQYLTEAEHREKTRVDRQAIAALKRTTKLQAVA